MTPAHEVPTSSPPVVGSAGETHLDPTGRSSPPTVVGGGSPLPPVAEPNPYAEAPDQPLPAAGAMPKRGELMLILLVTILALFLASSPVRNSDLWMHLANGRLLAQGEYSFSIDPAISPSATVNPAWLFDLLCYGLYSALGGPGLVLPKVLAVVGLILLLLRLSWTGQGWWMPAGCTALALLAVSTRLLLQPATVSYLLLALTLWFVQSREGVSRNRKISLLPPWPLLILFVVWVNTDAWFLLGLGTVALVWLGQTFDDAQAAWSEGRPVQGWVQSLFLRAFSFSLLCMVCLLNPSHIHAFLSPPELGWFGPSAATAGPAASELAAYPLQWVESVNIQFSPAGLAYFSLLGLGLLSFILNLPRWQWHRVLPWFGLAVLSAFQVRAVPFFAVVGGPVLAWNVQEFLAFRINEQLRQKTFWRWGRDFGQALGVLLGMGLVICAWPGWLQRPPWLQGPPYEPRRWAVETPPSLQEGAVETERWLREGKLGTDAKGLHLSRESADAFAWFCPEEKGVRNDALASAILRDPGAADVWGEQMRSAGINHMILYEPDHGKLFAALGGLLANSEQWPLLYMEGDLGVFGWRDPAGVVGQDSFRDLQVDFNRLAYHPAKDKQAPRERPEREPEVRQWWDAFWKPTPPRTIDRDAATLYLFLSEALRRSAPQRHQAVWEGSQAAGLVGAAGGWAGPGGLLDARIRLTLLQPVGDPTREGVPLTPLDDMTVVLQTRFARQRDDTSPALLYLSIRAARRALAINPDEAQTYVVLGESYIRLLHSTRERFWAANMRELLELRHAQASAALNQAVKLKPDFAQAHLKLYELYHEMGYLDLELNHLKTYVRLASDAGPLPGVDAEQFRLDKERFQAELSRLAQVVEDQENAYEVEAARSKGVLDRAILAYRRGLAGKARDLLLASDISAFGRQGAKLELDLLLGTGRSKDVQDWTSPEHEGALGASNYHWLRAQALAASANYAQAEEECRQLARAVVSASQGEGPVRARQIMAAVIGQAVFNGQPAGGSAGQLFWHAFGHVTYQLRVAELTTSLKRDADVSVLRGLLALEQGEVDEAAIAFRLALLLWQDEETAASGGGIDFNGRPVAQAYLELLR